jgi:hypothetical protein
MYSRHCAGFLARSVLRRMLRAPALQLPHLVFIFCTKTRSTFTNDLRDDAAYFGSDFPNFNDAAKLGSGKEMVDRLTIFGKQGKGLKLSGDRRRRGVDLTSGARLTA